ncbi:glycosyltransferase family 39 protein [Candidatus Woesebacteria bacterium]|nr:glycosyltransferase family 39 protein [Candidatus Woesebacteria bacterium]
MKKQWYLWSILAILFLAVVIRFYKIAEVPHGMTWDEAAIGYNGYAIFNTRRDEWLHRLPVSFQSFGDYKAPLAIYLNGVFTFIFGLNLFAVRLPFALFSILAVLGIILMVREIFEGHKYQKYYSLFAGFLLTLSPWHIHYSRAGFESGMALSLLIWGIYFLIKSTKQNFNNFLTLAASFGLFVASIYTYHSSKVTIPLLGIVFLILYWKQILVSWKKISVALIVSLGLLFPLIKDSLFGSGLTRAGVTIFSSDLSFVQKIAYVIKSTLIHLSPDFLLTGTTTTLRHGTGYLGVLFITTFFLVTAGVIALLKERSKSKYFKYQLLFVSLVIFGLLPASIALEVPHSNRALLALPGFLLLAVFGFNHLILLLEKTKLNTTVSGSFDEQNIIAKSATGTVIAIHILFAVTFLSHYFSVFSKESTDSFNDGYLEAFSLAAKYEKGLDGYPEVEKIIFTSRYGQPYIYALFVRKTNPIWYQGGSLVKYEFYENVNVGDLLRNNALIVGSGLDDLPTEQADHIIYGTDGSIRFQIFKTGVTTQ